MYKCIKSYYINIYSSGGQEEFPHPKKEDSF